MLRDTLIPGTPTRIVNKTKTKNQNKVGISNATSALQLGVCFCVLRFAGYGNCDMILTCAMLLCCDCDMIRGVGCHGNFDIIFGRFLSYWDHTG